MDRSRSRLLASTACGVLAVVIVACGQITGLSDDYSFDLLPEAGASETSTSTDAAKTDAPIDAPVDSAQPKCSPTAVTSAQQRLGTLKGTAACKTCLATSCCSDVETCSKTATCQDHVACLLDCTDKVQGDPRTQCFARCNNPPAPALYTSGLGACAAQACKQQCAFQ